MSIDGSLMRTPGASPIASSRAPDCHVGSTICDRDATSCGQALQENELSNLETSRYSTSSIWPLIETVTFDSPASTGIGAASPASFMASRAIKYGRGELPPPATVI